jgi:hypothetical protein
MSDKDEEIEFEKEVEPEKDIDYESDGKAVRQVFEDKISDKDLSDRWKNRRRMAWLSIVAMIVFTTLCLFFVSAERLDTVKDIVIWVNMSFTSIVGFYMGATAYVDKFRDIKGFKN